MCMPDDINTPQENYPEAELTPAPPIPQAPAKTKSKLKVWLIGLLTIIVVLNVLGGISLWYDKSKLPKDTQGAQPVTIYAEEVATTLTDKKSIQSTMNIMRKVANHDPEVLARNITGASRYASEYLLSTDKKFLAISLGHRLQLLSFENKRLADIYTPKYRVASMVFSPDSSKMLIWDHYIGKIGYQVVEVDLKTKETNILISDTMSDDRNAYHTFVAWRSDNKVVMYGEPAYYLDLTTKTIAQVPGVEVTSESTISEDGTLVTYPKGKILDGCGSTNAPSINSIAIFDTLSNKEVAVLKAATGRLVDVVISPDNKSVLYSSVDVMTKGDTWGCLELLEKKMFYLMSLSDKSIKKITNPEQTLSVWKNNVVLKEAPDLTHKHSMGPLEPQIKFNGKILVTSSKRLVVLAHFYE